MGQRHLHARPLRPTWGLTATWLPSVRTGEWNRNDPLRCVLRGFVGTHKSIHVTWYAWDSVWWASQRRGDARQEGLQLSAWLVFVPLLLLPNCVGISDSESSPDVEWKLSSQSCCFCNIPFSIRFCVPIWSLHRALGHVEERGAQCFQFDEFGPIVNFNFEP